MIGRGRWEGKITSPSLSLEADGAGVPQPLLLAGVDLDLLAISLDGQPLADQAFAITDQGLTLLQPPAGAFVLKTLVRLEPQANTSLEGLYVSGGMVTTQCEAEGFRRITFHPDRPDVLSCFRVRLEADLETYPVLLSKIGRAHV